MKNILLGFWSLILVGCSSCNLEKIVYPNDYKVYDATIGGPVKRIYLMHGYGGDRKTYDAEPFASFRQGLQDQGFQVVTFSQPYATRGMMMRDAGFSWGQAFTEYVRNLRKEIDSKYGIANLNIAGGISFGGLHAMMAVELMPDLFDAYFASKPVVKFNALIELKGIYTTNFDPYVNKPALEKIPGFIQWGTNDMRVDYRLTEELVSSFKSGSDLTYVRLQGEEHNSTPANLQNILDWLQRF